jgi:hypothetical protein
MPREVVHCDGPFHVKVGWAADRDVQLGVEGDEGRSLNWLLYGGDDTLQRIGAQVYSAVQEIRDNPGGLEASAAHRHRGTIDAELELGRRILNALDCVPHMPAQDAPPGENVSYGYKGVWATLDRHGINRLIRLLRKARDSAFGADA